MTAAPARKGTSPNPPAEQPLVVSPVQTPFRLQLAADRLRRVGFAAWEVGQQGLAGELAAAYKVLVHAANGKARGGLELYASALAAAILGDLDGEPLP